MRRRVLSAKPRHDEGRPVSGEGQIGRRWTWPSLCVVVVLLFVSTFWGIIQAQGAPTASGTGTIGNLQAGPIMDTKDSNYIDGSRFVSGTSGGQVTSMSVYVGSIDVAPFNQYQLAIYTDHGGKPYSLVVKSATGTLTGNSWNSLPLSATLAANTAYWLMYNTNGSNGSVNNVVYSHSTSLQSVYLSQAFGAWPANITAADLGTWDISIYAILSGALAIMPTTSAPALPTAITTPVRAQSGTRACQFQSASHPVSVAFCETFNNPAGIGNRSGSLNGTLWGVSRWTGNTNLGSQLVAWSPTQENRCGATVTVQPDNDVSICNGQLVEGANDGGTVTALAMYPKQPFDIANRTGTVVFDVSNNTQGSHAAWPEFWYTDKPVPAPFVHEGPGGAQNAFGVRFAAVCGPGRGPNCGRNCPATNTSPVFTVDSAVVVRNWQVFDTFIGTGNGLTVTDLNCVIEATGPGNMNHIELRITQNEIDIYATNAGTTSPLVEIATITNANLTLTRGLIWLEDVHYNGDKLDTQRTHTFTWDNVGFDGPTLPRDLTFDVNDSVTGRPSLQDGDTGVNLGWTVPSDGTSLSLTAPNVSGITQATAGLLAYNFYSYSTVTISYSLNNGPWHAIAWPYPDSKAYVLRPVAVPISLSEVRAGTNTIRFRASGGAVIANIDLVMVGAGGIIPATS